MLWLVLIPNFVACVLMNVFVLWLVCVSVWGKQFMCVPLCLYFCMCEVEIEVVVEVMGVCVCVFVCCNKWVAACVWVWVHLGADDSLRGSLYVGRQTKECRSVILWEILNYAAVVLGRHTDTGHTQMHPHAHMNREIMSACCLFFIIALRHKTLELPSNTKWKS